MEMLGAVLNPWIDAASGQYGSIGLFTIAQHAFIAFGLIGGAGSWLIDAPFGRYASNSSWYVNGNLAWFLMELVSPVSFLAALATPLSSAPLKWRWPTLLSLAHHQFNWSNLSVTTRLHPLAAVSSAFAALTPARRVLALLFVAHYLNRSVVSSLRNPNRARMHVVVPLSAALFNFLNGGLQAYAIAGGLTTPARGATAWNGGWAKPWAAQGWAATWGVQPGLLSAALFWGGLALFLAGLAGNIASDETLYAIKRSKLRRHTAQTQVRTLVDSETAVPKARRYSIPHGLLYDHPFGGVSQPSYLAEWVEWLGFCLVHAALVPGTFPLGPPEQAGRSPLRALLKPRREGVAAMVRRVPAALRPFTQWWAQPPVLFLINEVAVMLPRAARTQRWYKDTFPGAEFPEGRKAVIPGVY